MILREFRLDDLTKNSQFKAIDKIAQTILVDSLRDHTKNAYTLEHEGKIIGSAGFISPWPGVANGWGFFSELIYKYPLTLHKTMKRMIPIIEAKHGIVRLQADCLKGFDKAVKWLERLGFEQEGEMRNYGPNGETMIRFARIK